MAEIILAQATGGATLNGLGDYGGNEYRVRQSFTLTSPATITKATVQFAANYGSPAGQVTLRIETDNAGQASGTLAHADATLAFTPTPSANNTIDFTDFPLTPGTYWLVLNCANQSTNNMWQILTKDPGNYSGGNWANTTDGAWLSFATQDMNFALYGILPETPGIINFI